MLKVDTSDEMWKYVIQDEEVPVMFVLPRLHANIALPFDFELGFSGALVPNSNIYLIGGELKWSLVGTHNSFLDIKVPLDVCV